MLKKQILVLGRDNAIGQRIVAELNRSDWASAVVSASLTEAGLKDVSIIINATTGTAHTVRTTATALFTAAAKLCDAPRIVHIGSMTVYGSATGDVVESAPLLGDVSDYAAAHVHAEMLARQYPNAVVLRPGCEYGPGCAQWSERIGRWLIARRIGDLGARGDGCCNLLYVDDLVNASLRAASDAALAGECFNLCSTRMTWNDYLIQYAKALRAVPVRRITNRRLKVETRLLAAPLKIAEIITNKLGIKNPLFPEAIPPSFIRLCEQDIRLVSSKAETTLNIRWTPVDEGLKSAADSLTSKH